MKVTATFENGNPEYVTHIFKNEKGETTDATVSIYPHEIEEQSIQGLKKLFPDVSFKIV